MTTSPVASITDEQLADLEQAALEIKGWQLTDVFQYSDIDSEHDDEEWCVGRLDEDGFQYPVMEVNAHQYDSQDSELLAHYYGLCNREAILCLIARLRESEKDAARYRWLRDEALHVSTESPAVVVADEFGNQCEGILYEERLDAAIDTAMEQQP